MCECACLWMHVCCVCLGAGECKCVFMGVCALVSVCMCVRACVCVRATHSNPKSGEEHSPPAPDVET